MERSKAMLRSTSMRHDIAIQAALFHYTESITSLFILVSRPVPGERSGAVTRAVVEARQNIPRDGASA